MPSLFSTQVRVAINHRLERLVPTSRRQWGTFEVHDMVCHLIDGMRIAFGEVSVPVRPSRLDSWYGRWFVIDAPFPWPKGKIHAPPEFFVTKPEHEFLWDHNRVVEYVHRFGNGPHQNWGVSPILGRLSPHQWARLTWRHLDHHLRQFGC
jgi:hypothetical protein